MMYFTPFWRSLSETHCLASSTVFQWVIDAIAQQICNLHRINFFSMTVFKRRIVFCTVHSVQLKRFIHIFFVAHYTHDETVTPSSVEQLHQTIRCIKHLWHAFLKCVKAKHTEYETACAQRACQLWSSLALAMHHRHMCLKCLLLTVILI